MKTICLDLADEELAALRAEPQAWVEFYATRISTYLHKGELIEYEETELRRVAQLPERMVRRITVDNQCGCWLVSGMGTGKGHAKVSVKGRDRQFHRVVYQLHIGPIPPGLILDHVKARGCLHRNCANPGHLEPVTVKENTDRGEGVKHQFGHDVKLVINDKTYEFHEGYDEA